MGSIEMKNEFGKWHFPITWVDQVPVIVGRGFGGDPAYPIMSEEGVQACIKFYEDAKLYLSGRTNAAPRLDAVIAAAVPHAAILAVSLANDTDLFGPKALVSIEDADRPHERLKRKPRWFDPEFIPALLLLTAPGGSLRFNDSRGKTDSKGLPTKPEDRRLLISFGRRQNQNIRILRVIANASAGSQIHRLTVAVDRSYHYDYRKNSLSEKQDESVIKYGKPAGYSGKGRAAAIGAAGEHFDRAAKRQGKAALSHLAKSRAGFEKLLRSSFDIADRLHAEASRLRRDG
jgi:hypothetical protein